MLVPLAIASESTPVSAGKVSSVPPPAMEFITPAKNAAAQSAASVQLRSGIGT